MKMKKIRAALSLSITLLAAIAAHAQEKLPSFFSDHMLVQRLMPIHIWGWSAPSQAISVSFRKQTVQTQANDLGEWSVYLAPEQPGGPDDLTVRGQGTIVLTDILVGDLWLASGQSNMEMPLAGFPGSATLLNGPQEITAANDPQIRLLHVSHHASDFPVTDITGTWNVCTPESATHFSAVAYFFGRELRSHENVPIGLIDSTWGGTPAEAWISLESLSADASLMPVFAARADMVRHLAEVPLLQQNEKAKDAAAVAAHLPVPQHPWHPDPASWAPAGLYNGMIAPLTGLPIKGVIWYQGESNSGQLRANMYRKVFPTLIADWRNQWAQGDFPFLFAQISSFKSSASEDWGTIRDAQRRSLSATNTAMAVTIDVGDPDNVHPSDKQTVGHRLALAARALAYHESLEYSGPLIQTAVPEGTQMRLWWTHYAAGLRSKGRMLQGFEVAGADHHFYPANATIDKDTVLVSSSQVPQPVFVRYAWPNATQANLENSDGLPASTFTTEDPALPASLGFHTP